MTERIDLNNVSQYLIDRARAERLKRQLMEERLDGRGLFKVTVKGGIRRRDRFTVFVAASDAQSAANYACEFANKTDYEEYNEDCAYSEPKVVDSQCIVSPRVDTGTPEIIEEA